MLSSIDREICRQKMEREKNKSHIVKKPSFSPRATKAPPSPRKEILKPPPSPRKETLKSSPSPRKETFKPPISPRKETLRPPPSPRKETLKPPSSPRTVAVNSIRERRPLSVVSKASNVYKEQPMPPSPLKKDRIQLVLPGDSSKQRSDALLKNSPHTSVSQTAVLVKSDSIKCAKSKESPSHSAEHGVQRFEIGSRKNPSMAQYSKHHSILSIRQKSPTLSEQSASTTSLCAECSRASQEGAVCFIDNDGRIAASTTRSAVRLCKNYNCAANNPDYIAPMASANKKPLFSKQPSTPISKFRSRKGIQSPKTAQPQETGVEASRMNTFTIDSIDHDFSFLENSDLDYYDYNGDLGILSYRKNNLELYTDQNESGGKGKDGRVGIRTVGDREGTRLLDDMQKDEHNGEVQMAASEEKKAFNPDHDYHYVLDKESNNDKLQWVPREVKFIEDGCDDDEDKNENTLVGNSENCPSHQEDGDKAQSKVKLSQIESNSASHGGNAYHDHEDADPGAIGRKTFGEDAGDASKQENVPNASCWKDKKESLSNVEEYLSTSSDGKREVWRWPKQQQQQQGRSGGTQSPKTLVLRKQQTQVGKVVEEWLPNHAIEEVVNKLAPKGENKVKTLVKAFESITH